MAEKTVGIKVEVDSKQASKSLGDLESEFEKLNEEIRKVPINSKEFNELNKQIAQTGREVKNLELSMESLDNEQVASELGSVAGAVGDVSAAFILLGDDSETMQEVAKNIEFAMGLSMGLKGAIEGVSSARKLLTNSTVVQNTVEKIGNLVKVGTFATNAQLAASEVARGTATAGATAATSAATVGMKLFRLALIATGIGAIVVGIGLLIANFDKVTEAVKGAGKWILGLSDRFQKLGTSAKVLIGFLTFGIAPAISFLIEKAKELGIVETQEAADQRARAEAQVKAKQREVKIKIDLINEEIKANKKLTEELTNAIDFEIAKRSAAGEDFSKLEEEKITMLINSARIEIDLINQKIEAKQKEIEFSKGAMAGLIQGSIEGFKMQQEAQKESINTLVQDLELFHIKQDKLKSDSIKKDVKKEKEHQEELTKAKSRGVAEREKLDTSNIDAFKAQNDLRLELMEEGLKKENQLAQNAFFERLAQLEEEGALTTDLKRRLFEDFEVEKQERERQYRLQRLEEGISIAENYANSVNSLAQNVFAISNNLGKQDEKSKEERSKRQFKIQKALSLSMAVIDGIKAVTSSLSQAPIAIGPIPNPAGIASLAFAAITSAASIAKIASQKYKGGTSGVGGVPRPSFGNTSAGSTGANLDPVTNTTTTIGDSTRVYVTEQDISDTQNKVSVNEAQATI